MSSDFLLLGAVYAVLCYKFTYSKYRNTAVFITISVRNVYSKVRNRDCLQFLRHVHNVLCTVF